MAQGLIDVWHDGTFDEDLKTTLARKADLIFRYFTTAKSFWNTTTSPAQIRLSSVPPILTPLPFSP